MTIFANVKAKTVKTILLFISIFINFWLFTSTNELSKNEIKRAEEIKLLNIQNTNNQNNYILRLQDIECQKDSISKHFLNKKSKIIIRYEKDRNAYINVSFNSQLDIWTRHTRE